MNSANLEGLKFRSRRREEFAKLFMGVEVYGIIEFEDEVD